MQESFECFISVICTLANWNILKLNDRQAILGFPMNSGRVRVVYIIRHGSILEFMVPTAAEFSSFEEMPHKIASVLLIKNANYPIGGWTLEKIEDKLVYAISYKMKEDCVTSDYFIKLVLFLLSEAQRFEEYLAELYRDLNSASYSSNQSEFDWGHLFQVGVEALLKTVIEGEINSLYDQ